MQKCDAIYHFIQIFAMQFVSAQYGGQSRTGILASERDVVEDFLVIMRFRIFLLKHATLVLIGLNYLFNICSYFSTPLIPRIILIEPGSGHEIHPHSKRQVLKGS